MSSTGIALFPVRCHNQLLKEGNDETSKGIGHATALALAEAGAHVLVHHGRSVQEAQSLVSAIQSKGGRADAVSVDLASRDGAFLLAKQVRSLAGDRLDVLVLNAGISKAAPIADLNLDDFDNLYATNVRGPFFFGSATTAVVW